MGGAVAPLYNYPPTIVGKGDFTAKILVLTSIFGMKFQTFKYFSHFFTFSLNFWPKKGWSQIFTFLLFFQLCHSSALVGGGQSIAMNWIKLANNVKQINLGCCKIIYVT